MLLGGGNFSNLARYGRREESCNSAQLQYGVAGDWMLGPAAPPTCRTELDGLSGNSARRAPVASICVLRRAHVTGVTWPALTCSGKPHFSELRHLSSFGGESRKSSRIFAAISVLLAAVECRFFAFLERQHPISGRVQRTIFYVLERWQFIRIITVSFFF